MFCEKCGTLIAPKKSCPYCNRPKDEYELPKKEPEPVSNMKVCLKCGSRMKSDSVYKYCYECRREDTPKGRAENEYDEAHPTEPSE